MTYWKPALVFAAIALATSSFSVASAQFARGCPVDPSGNPVSSAPPGQLARTVSEGTRIGSVICRDGGWVRAGGRNPPPTGIDMDLSPPEMMGGGVWKGKRWDRSWGDPHPGPGGGLPPSGGEPPGPGGE